MKIIDKILIQEVKTEHIIVEVDDIGNQIIIEKNIYYDELRNEDTMNWKIIDDNRFYNELSEEEKKEINEFIK